MAKVRCRFCEFEQGGKCLKKKNATIKLNKKRACSNYQGSEEKIMEWAERRDMFKTESIFRPDWLWDRKARRSERDRLVREEMMKQYQTTAAQDITISNPSDSKHPVTGDLSRFIGSTVEENKDE
jgi:hypothetical protein